MDSAHLAAAIAKIEHARRMLDDGLRELAARPPSHLRTT
jgi:hypothetical protein